MPANSAPATAAVPGDVFIPEQKVGFTDYWKLGKPRLSLLAAIISAAGYYVGAEPGSGWTGGLLAFVATFIVSCGAMALNQYLERDTDALMRRTRKRPIASGRVAAGPAFVVGVIVAALGILILTFAGNLAAGAVGAVAVASYVMIYTPMKRVSSFNTIVGAVPGALPPVIGYTVATGRLDFPGVLLFAIMFLWQLPHFLSIAWVCREDYARAGMRMLTVIDERGAFTARQVVLYSLALLIISPMPTLIGMAGWVYGSVALLSGVLFLVLGMRWFVQKDLAGAKRVFFASLLHVTLLFLLMTFDKAS